MEGADELGKDIRTRSVAVLLAVALALVMSPASASRIGRQLATARANQHATLAHLAELRRELATLADRYGALERLAGRASLRLVEANRAVRSARAAAATAQARLDRRARTVYEFGAGGIIDAYLGARSFADVAAANEYTSRALSADAGSVQAKRSAEAALTVRQAAAVRAGQTLAHRQRSLARLLSRMRETVATARRLAARAGVQVKALERRQRALSTAAQREVGRNLLEDGVVGKDQSELLALLGPTGGRTCATPQGLSDTGKSFGGLASWYGWEFAGQTTANGAIFDPRLFTAANRWLPFGTFLKVRFGGKCAIVLVNDRGPYGDRRRVIDLSMAAARYLGVGVSPVRAQILVPASTA